MPFITDFLPDPRLRAARQRILEKYIAVSNMLKDLAPSLPASLQFVVKMYMTEVESVIARGPTQSDLSRIEAKLAEWEGMLLSQIAIDQAATERIAAEYAAEAAAERERLQRVALESRVTSREYAELVAAAEAAGPIPYMPPVGPPIAETIKTGLFENPVLIAVAVGALIFLLKK